MADDTVSGAVALAGAEPQPFTASLAAGDAGLYRAEWTVAGVEGGALFAHTGFSPTSA